MGVKNGAKQVVPFTIVYGWGWVSAQPEAMSTVYRAGSTRSRICSLVTILTLA